MPDSVDRVVWDDVIQMHEITRLQDFLCEEDDMSADAQGIFAIHTSSKGRNRGRKYCLQVVGLVTSALAAEFADIDADNSGDITIDELRAAMTRLNANVTEEAVQQKWRGMDLNGDGTIGEKPTSPSGSKGGSPAGSKGGSPAGSKGGSPAGSKESSKHAGDTWTKMDQAQTEQAPPSSPFHASNVPKLQTSETSEFIVTSRSPLIVRARLEMTSPKVSSGRVS